MTEKSIWLDQHVQVAVHLVIMIELAHFSHRAYATGEGALEDKLVNLAGFLVINLAGFLMMNVTGLLAAKTPVICAPP